MRNSANVVQSIIKFVKKMAQFAIELFESLLTARYVVDFQL